MRRWWQDLKTRWLAPGRPPLAFAVACRCGHVLRGPRQVRAQVLPCPVCGRNVFVLAVSPYPEGDAPPATPAQLSRPSWRGPIQAASLTLVGVLLLFVLAWGLLRRPEPASSAHTEEGPARALAARRFLSEGHYHRAAEEARAALESARSSALPDDAERRRLVQTWREADLYDRLLPVPLEDLLAAAHNEPVTEQWEASFRRNAAGRTVLFDDVLRRDAHHQPVLACYAVEVDGVRARVVLGELELFRHLPLEPPPRVLFGARLAALHRETDGWVVRFEPDSGVLLTDPHALEACCPGLVDQTVRDALLRQQDWLPRLPGQLPR